LRPALGSALRPAFDAGSPAFRRGILAPGRRIAFLEGTGDWFADFDGTARQSSQITPVTRPSHETDENGTVVDRIPVERGQESSIVDPSDERVWGNGTATATAAG
jgi:hypothetical protein